MRGDEGARRWGECLKVGKQALNVEAVIMNKETAQLMDEPNVTELHDTPTTTADEASSPDLFTALESAMILEKKKKKKLWRSHRRFSTEVMKKINFKACQKHLNQVLEILTPPRACYSFVLHYPPGEWIWKLV